MSMTAESGADLQSVAATESSPKNPLITFRNVSKRYANGTLALNNINFTIRDGEFVSLLGPSGCGKSTLLRMIAGLGSVTSGAIDWIAGRNGLSSAPDVGFVFQEPTLMPWATVFNNVYLPLKLAGIGRKEAKARIDEALAMVGLEPFADAYPRQLSGGMKMRVSIARALVVHPKVLLLDEPFAALDEITRFRLNNDLLTLWQQQQWTVIFVTHSVFESVFLSERILVMSPRPGRVLSDLPISAPYPRDDSFRTSGSYHDFCRTTSAALGGAMHGALERE
jgi:NitT/TauT family transport system ATP-binding protein